MLTINSNFAHNFDWNLLKTFEEIVQAGGLSRAAAEWHRKQPALSLALKRLEERVGATLCHRGPGGFRLTEEGERLAEMCASITRLITHIPEQVAHPGDEQGGRVRVQVISNLINPTLDRAIASVHQSTPNVEIDVGVATWEVVTQSLLDDEIDIGLAPFHFEHAALHYRFLFNEVHRPYCGASHPLYGCTMEHPSRLAGQRFILTGADEPDELTAFRLRHGLGQRVAGVSDHLEEARRLARLGLGVCFLPEAFAEGDAAGGKLWPLLHSTDSPSMAIFVITNRKVGRSRAVSRFLDQLIGVEAGPGDLSPGSLLNH